MTITVGTSVAQDHWHSNVNLQMYCVHCSVFGISYIILKWESFNKLRAISMLQHCLALDTSYKIVKWQSFKKLVDCRVTSNWSDPLKWTQSTLKCNNVYVTWIKVEAKNQSLNFRKHFRDRERPCTLFSRVNNLPCANVGWRLNYKAIQISSLVVIWEHYMI